MPRKSRKDATSTREAFIAKKAAEQEAAKRTENTAQEASSRSDVFEVEEFELDAVGIVAIILLGICLKFLLLPAYRSTDFEVHRNWLAITSSLPLEEWYFNAGSEWTLDYPPLFAWFEKLLGYFAQFFDASMLDIKNLNYASPQTILFQRLTVMISELVLFASILMSKRIPKSSDATQAHAVWDDRSRLLVLAAFNAGLLITDHIHFQYNGMLLGLLVLSITAIQHGHDLLGGLLFAVLVNMKHLYLSLAPAYFIFLLKHHCLNPPTTGCWNTGSGWPAALARLAVLGAIVLAIFAASFGPFYLAGGLPQLEQILRRLFPFERGLCHAYWAPNVWVAYNLADKALFRLLGPPSSSPLPAAALSPGHMTGGRVGDAAPVWLPAVTPAAAAALSLAAMAPALALAWRARRPRGAFLALISYCGQAAFLWGYHVHEKAALTAAVPLLLLATRSPRHARLYALMCNVTHAQLMPLLYGAQERPLRLALWALHASLAAALLPRPPSIPRKQRKLERFLERVQNVYQAGLVVILELADLLLPVVAPGLPFLPLLLRSAYCLPGMAVCALETLCILYLSV